MEGLEELEKIKKFQFTYPILRIGKEKRETTTIGKIFEKELSTIENELKEYEMEHTLRVRLENVNYELVREKQENEKKLKALNEIVALHDKWLGNEMSDFEFFTLLNDIKYKYGLENEVLK